MYKVEVGISNKHLHLSQADVELLFGKGHQLTPIKELKQPGQYAAEEKVDVIGPKGKISGLRVIGPARPETQIEISLTDSRMLGINPPIRQSGNLKDTPGAKIIGPAGEVDLDHGIIVALRHIHLSPSEAASASVKDGELVDVNTYGTRPLIFEDVIVRSGDAHAKEFHVDTDEANAAGLSNNDLVDIIKK
jgi:putative phosphotransacetylase